METCEKIYCMPERQDNGLLTATLMNNGQWNNNPFAYMMMTAMMRYMFGDGWQGRGYDQGYTELNGRMNQLSNQLSDNHNTDIIMEAVRGNNSRLGELANNLNCDFKTVQSGICAIQAAIQQVAGETKFSAERVINSANLGNLNIIQQLKDCCCSTQKEIVKGNYENQLATAQQTSVMQSGFDRTNTGLERGFSAVAYESQRQTCDVINAINAAQQRTADLLNNHWQDETARALQDEKFKNSQLQQNIYMRDLIERGNGCGCGTNNLSGCGC